MQAQQVAAERRDAVALHIYYPVQSLAQQIPFAFRIPRKTRCQPGRYSHIFHKALSIPP